MENNNEESSKPKVNGVMFSKDYQPSNEAKRYGHWKKKRGKQMMKALLALPFNSLVPADHKDPNSPLIPNPLKKQAADYLGVPEQMITVEMIMAIKQLAMAVQKNDTSAFNAVWEKAYGKVKEDDDEDKAPPPVINITIGNVPDNVPEITESESEAGEVIE